MAAIESFIRRLPKTELHLHIEGTLEPELMFELAKRNKVKLKYKNVEQVRRAYQFTDLQSFLNIYYQAADVLRTERDFFDLAWAYLKRAHDQNLKHVEIFFDPQTHTSRGIPFEAVLHGLRGALELAELEWGLTSKLILCILRHLSADDAMKTFREALPYKGWIAAIGLDSGEKGNPPSKFKKVFDRARDEGFLTVAHAGEEGPPEYIWEALDVLGVKRIDHGVRCVEDPKLVKRLAADRTPLTVCPLSNLKLRVVDKLEDHPLKKLLDLGVCATINSDDPAYFGGYVQANYTAAQKALKLTQDELRQLARNGFEASFLPLDNKKRWYSEIAAV